METENPYVQEPERPRYGLNTAQAVARRLSDSERLLRVSGELEKEAAAAEDRDMRNALYVAARATKRESYHTAEVPHLVLLRGQAMSGAYTHAAARKEDAAKEEPAVAEPVTLEALLPSPVA